VYERAAAERKATAGRAWRTMRAAKSMVCGFFGGGFGRWWCGLLR
jgi:hypothetical protein